MKLIKKLIILALIGVFITMCICLDIDTLIYIFVAPIILLCVILFICYGLGANYNGGVSTGRGTTYTKYKSDSIRTNSQYVPGVGYRDTYGNYYDSKYVPIVPTVNINDK